MRVEVKKSNMSSFVNKIFNSIKNFFNRLFNNEKPMLNKASDEGNVINFKQESVDNNSISIIKKENKKKQTVKEIVSMTEKNPELLKNLSYEQLDVIDKYYKEENERLQKEIDIINEKVKDVKGKIISYDEIIKKYNLNAG